MLIFGGGLLSNIFTLTAFYAPKTVKMEACENMWNNLSHGCAQCSSEAFYFRYDGLCFVCLFLRWIFLLSKWLQSRVFESGAKFMTLEQVQVNGKEEHKE